MTEQSIQEYGLNAVRFLLGKPMVGHKGAHQVLVACMPKSGSTYLSAVLEAMPGMIRGDLVLDYDRREQELALERLILLRPHSYAAQHHIRCSEPTTFLIGHFGIETVVLVRNLFDVVVSYRDHIRTGEIAGPSAYIEPHMVGWPDERLQDFIVDMVIPWYFNFYVSWYRHDRNLLLRYEDLVADPPSAVTSLASRLRMPSDAATIGAALEKAKGRNTRFNRGRPGRGADELTAPQQQRIKAMAAYYPDVDFGPIGL